MEAERGNGHKKQPDQLRLKAPETQPQPQKCPRCHSSNTKFCYFNNYSFAQPRYFCKTCRRYWTHGGALRNVPVGGGCRKTKRPKTDPESSSGSGSGAAETDQPMLAPIPSQTLPDLSAVNVPTMRPLHPAPAMGSTYFRGSSFLASMQSMSPGISQGSARTLGAGRGRYEEVNLRPQAPPPLPLPHPPLHPLTNPAHLPWPQSFFNTSMGPAALATTSAGTSFDFWSSIVDSDSDDQDGPSFDPGFDPSSP